jgi:arylsulfate sulfotransferase
MSFILKLKLMKSNLRKNTFCCLLALFVITFVGCKKDISPITIASEPQDGVILVSPYKGGDVNSGQLLILDKYGNIVSYKKTAAETFNFERWEVDGKVRYTYLEHNPNATNPISSLSITPCYAVVLDENLNEMMRLSLLPESNENDTQTAVDSHEFIYIDDNHFIVIAYLEKAVNNIPASLNSVKDCKVLVPIIQEIKNDEVVFEWDASNYPEFYEQSVEGNAFSDANAVNDYIHLNSVDIDPRDNNLICSLRHLNQVIKIDRTNGNIIWRLGGKNSDFSITNDMKFLRQHDVTLTDNNETLLMYDNGEATERPFSRVAEFKLDEASKTVTSYKSFNVPGGIFSAFMGSVQKRGDTYFIGCGSVPKMMEVNYITGNVNFLMQLDNPSYRAFKY